MKNRCQCGNVFNDANLANWIFPSRQEGNRVFAKCKKCGLELEAFSEPHEEGAAQGYWIDPEISPGKKR